MKDQSRRGKYADIILTAAFFSLTIFFFAPAQIYLSNSAEFYFSYATLAVFSCVLSLVVALWLIIFLRDLKGVFYDKILSLVVTASVACWIQGNILVWQCGLLDGSPIVWQEYTVQIIFDSALWMAALSVGFFLSDILCRLSRVICILFIIIQSVSAFLLVMHAPQTYSFQRYTVDESDKFSFSAKRNVIIVVLDGFQANTFQSIIEKEEQLRDVFRGFTFFRNALTGFPNTYAAIPLALTGQYYKNDMPIQEFIRQSYLSTGVTKILKNHGFEVNLFPDRPKTIFFSPEIASNFIRNTLWDIQIPLVYDIAWFRYSPYPLKRYIYNNQAWFLSSLLKEQKTAQSYRRVVNSIDDDIEFIQAMKLNTHNKAPSDAFFLYCLRAAHMPYIVNEKLKHQDFPNGVEGYRKQARASLELMRQFLDTLQDVGVYDNSLIFIVGDHGMGYDMYPSGNPSASGGRKTVDEFVKARAIPLILVKPFSSVGALRLSDAPVSLADIPATIISQTGIRNRTTGESMLGIRDTDQRTRMFYMYYWQSAYWDDQCLPTMSEYSVSGFSWEDAAWKKTGTIFSSKACQKIARH